MKAQYANEVAIVTHTRYRESEIERVRARLAKKMIEKAIGIGYQVIVMDSGSLEDTKEWFRERGAILVESKQEGKRFGNIRRQGFQIAYELGKEAIVWTEPEKDGLISKLEGIVRLIIEKDADLVIVERESLDSYPEYQREFEIRGNSFFESLTGRKLDVLFAPRVFNRDVAKYFIN